MADERVSVERVGFDEYETAVEDVLKEYHESVAAGFRESLSQRGGQGEFTPKTYVDGELETDKAYLRSADAERPLVVALDGDCVVGCVYLYTLSEGTGEVKRLYVRDEYRGSGLGRRLMETLVESAERDGYSLLRLDTAPFMDSAHHLYRSLGFEPVDAGTSISAIPDPLLDEITYMRLRLGETQ